MIVINQIGTELVRMAAQEAIKPFKPPTQRPPFLGRSHIGLLIRKQMPFAQSKTGVTQGSQHLAQKTVFSWGSPHCIPESPWTSR